MAFGQLYPGVQGQHLSPKDNASKTVALNVAIRATLPTLTTYPWDTPHEPDDATYTPSISVTEATSPPLPRFDPSLLRILVTMGNAPSSVMDSLVEGSNCTFPA